ncbi:unnamed protein product [Periconia digitata]|uniref:RWD domain-containing protein n=1 Tax=Periconia digitata TaxID=1303443 RepID=A0A9W4U5P0_9PLEO|nr:unnamed protein product [Periconia digitata]
MNIEVHSINTDNMTDTRTKELELLSHTWPEITITQDSAVLELPLELQNPIEIVRGNKKHSISHLPPLIISITLPEGYPEKLPPTVEISHVVLRNDAITKLKKRAAFVWEVYERVPILSVYLSDVMEFLDNHFDPDYINISNNNLEQVVAFDLQVKQEAFNKQSHECELCLEPKAGSDCYQTQDCGHVFCLECLRECFTFHIESSGTRL